MNGHSISGGANPLFNVAAGGGPLSTGMLIGLLFSALGAGRLYLSLRGRG